MDDERITVFLNKRIGHKRTMNKNDICLLFLSFLTGYYELSFHPVSYSTIGSERRRRRVGVILP